MAKKLRMDWSIFALSASLALFGSVMVYSASAMIALKETKGESQFTYFNKQFGFTIAGLILMYAVSKINYKVFDNRSVVIGLIVVTMILLLVVFAFPSINGARRWIRLAGFSFQPSELAKVTLPVFLAYWLTLKENVVGGLKETVIPCVGVLGMFSAAMMLEPDLGTTLVLCAIFGAVYFAAGARLVHFGIVAATFAICGIAALIFAPWRVERLIAFMNPWEKADSSGYQVVQSLLAIGSGGVIGEGFAKGEQKLFYLPYPYSDFIFAVVGEELGLIGTLAVVIAFGLLLWRGTRAAVMAPDRFGMLLGMGIITGLIVQALFNISVVISILPAKGIPLPFISYGGSSILVTLFAMGILLNISQHAGFTSIPSSSEERKRRKQR